MQAEHRGEPAHVALTRGENPHGFRCRSQSELALVTVTSVIGGLRGSGGHGLGGPEGILVHRHSCTVPSSPRIMVADGLRFAAKRMVGCRALWPDDWSVANHTASRCDRVDDLRAQVLHFGPIPLYHQ